VVDETSPASPGGGEPPTIGISPARDRLFKILFVLFPVVVLLLLEGFFAWRFSRDYPGTTLAVQGRYRFIHSAYRSYANNPGYIRRRDGVAYRYDNYGFRMEQDFDLSKKGPREYRVFLLGGSAMYGGRALEIGQYQLISGQTTYPSSETIAAHLQRELQAAMPNREVRVFNAAVVNYTLVNDLMTYLALIRSLHPDFIVTMDGWNEKWRFHNPFQDPVLDASQYGGGPLAVWLRQHSYLVFYLTLGYRKSVLFERLNGYMKQQMTDQDFAALDGPAIRAEFQRRNQEAPYDAPGVEGRMYVYELFQRAAELDGIPILFTVQPVLTDDQTKHFTEKEWKLLKYQYAVVHAHNPQIKQLADRMARQAAADPTFHFLNLMDVFQDYDGEAYVDYCHMTPAANHHLAKRLAREIVAAQSWPKPTVAHAASAAAPGPPPPG
jgi:hypothetical protein